MKAKRTLLVAVALLVGAGCSSTRYKDPDDPETIDVDWGSTDLQTFSEHMTDSLLASPNLSYLERPNKGSDLRVIAVMGGVVNETDEHVNTEMITRNIRDALLESGKFRFVAGDMGQSEIAKQVRFQQGSGAVDPARAIAFGKQLGAEVVIYGSLASISKRKGRSLESLGGKTKDVYYQFVLNAVNVETGEILWSDSEDLRKTQVVSLFGSG